MSDLIDRQMVIDAVLRVAQTCPAEFENSGDAKMGYIAAIQSIYHEFKAISPAQPERKQGKWTFYEDRAPVWDIAGEKTWARVYKCSECGFVHSVIEDFGQYGFCPNCGADMREDNK